MDQYSEFVPSRIPRDLTCSLLGSLEEKGKVEAEGLENVSCVYNLILSGHMESRMGNNHSRVCLIRQARFHAQSFFQKTTKLG